VEYEIVGVLDLTFELFEAFGFTDYQVSLSTKPDKSVGDLAQWEYATKSLESALKLRELEFDIDEGGGAFYGPKIDIKIRDALGREWQCTTIQFDFNLPQRFDLTFQGDDGNQHRPYMIHRAILGSVERFVGILIEHYGGAFPVWLSPVQAVIIPIADRHLEYANNISNILKNKGIRVETDSRKERMNQKIRSGQLQKIPYMVIVGDQEVDNASVSPRSRDGENMGSMSVDELVDVILNQINSFR
jgi:threonyl-tRNA synthetase